MIVSRLFDLDRSGNFSGQWMFSFRLRIALQKRIDAPRKLAKLKERIHVYWDNHPHHFDSEFFSGASAARDFTVPAITAAAAWVSSS